MEILVVEPQNYSEKALETYKTIGNVSFYDPGRIISDAEILVCKLGHEIDKRKLDAMPNLKIVVCPATGTNHLDLEEMKLRGIKLINLNSEEDRPFLNTISSTAEHTFGLILALARRIPSAHNRCINARRYVNPDEFMGTQLRGKVLGILGMGRLGSMVAELGKAFGMRVLWVDKSPYPEHVPELFAKSDVLSVHVTLAGNEGFITSEHFSLMKPTAFFINTSRGEVLEKYALLQALENKKIAGAAIDVMHNELVGGERELKDYAQRNDNLIITPHVGGVTKESRALTEEYIADKVVKYVKALHS